MRLKDINKKLKELYGRLDDDTPIFRVVWTADQFEDRFGHYDDYYGDIFLRTYIGVRRVPKYQEDPPSFVLEKLLPNTTKEIQGNMTYEPMFFYKNDHGLLPVEWLPTQMIVWTVLYGPKVAAELLGRMQEKKEKENDQKILDYLENENPYLPGLLNDGAAVVNPWGKENFGGVDHSERSSVRLS